MTIPIYQVDAFTNKVFGGNPAAVCPLEAWLPDEVMQKIAAENNLSETAFFFPNHTKGGYNLRWFTPKLEIDLCGHATLATAHVIFEELAYEGTSIDFHTLSGILKVSKQDNLIVMDFPSRKPIASAMPLFLLEGLGLQERAVEEVLKSRDYVVVVKNEQILAALQVNFTQLEQVNTLGIIVTSHSNTVDFVSRFFAPRAGVNEDPVTGSAHCTLIPYWAGKLGKNELHAYQVSERKGELFCALNGERVSIAGQGVTYLKGMIQCTL
ncbi:MAG: PhzF family phenazine biosynthesis protein [Chitinophagales bacterium]